MMRHAGARKRTYVTSFRCRRHRTGEKIRWAEELSGSYSIDVFNAREARKQTLQLLIEEYGIYESNPGVWISETKRKAAVQDLGPMGDDPGYVVKIGSEYLRQWAPRVRKIKTTSKQDDSRRFHSRNIAQKWASKVSGRVVRLVISWEHERKRSGRWFVKTDAGKYVNVGGMGGPVAIEGTRNGASAFNTLSVARLWAEKQGFKRIVRVFRRSKASKG